MAPMTLDLVKSMHDMSLKPRLLQTLIRDHLPADDLASRSSLDLPSLIYSLKTHSLLSEAVPDPTDPKLAAHWRSAVDSWLERLLLLVSSDMPDRCWGGISLLGMTCQECSSERFAASYAVWYQKLLAPLQSPTTSQFVKVAACSSMSDLFTRLAGFPLVKKESTAHAGKLIPSVLKLLEDDLSEVVWEEAVRLLCVFISLFPVSVSRHYDIVEDAIAVKILTGKCSFNMLKKLAHCLALLPKSKGDEVSWSLMIQKVVLSINHHLNDVFQGFEEESKRYEGIRLLVPPGKDPPPPLGGSTLMGEASEEEGRKRSHTSLVSCVSVLIICCSTMLTSSYPVQVTAPIPSLLALIERVMDVDGSLSHSLRIFMSARQQELVCSELPHLHSCSLDLLSEILKGVRSQVLPHDAHIVRLLPVYLKRCVLPELRVKVYSVTRVLLISSGLGVAVSLAQEVVNSAIVDLNPIVTESSATTKPSTEALVQTPQSSNKKRKHGTVTSLEMHNSSNLEVETPKNRTRCSIAVQVAALEALEALLTVNGLFKSEGWRADVDLLLLNIASNCLRGVHAGNNTSSYQPNESNVYGNLQLAALRALLASFLSSSRVRPPYLAQGVDLFLRGKLESGTKLAEFCAHALLVLEVLIHPRSLPLADFSNTSRTDERAHHNFPGNIYSGSLNQKTSCLTKIQGTADTGPDMEHDELYSSWIETSKKMEAPKSNISEAMQIGEPSDLPEAIGDQMLSANSSLGKENIAGNEQENVAETTEDVETTGNRGRSIVELHERLFGRELENDPSVQADTSIPASDAENSKEFPFELPNDSDTDSIPDIVDMDPDSDSE